VPHPEGFVWWKRVQALIYTLPRGVGVGCLQVFMEWFVWMWRVSLSLAATKTKTSGAPGTGCSDDSQSRDGQGGVGGRCLRHSLFFFRSP